MSVLRRAYVKVAPDTTDFDRELRDRLRKIKSDTEGDRLGRDFGTAFTKRFDTQLKSLHIAPIDLKANPRDALEAINKTQRELEGLRDHAGTVELRMRSEKALGDLGRFRKQLGDVGEDAATGFAARFSQRVGPLIASGPGLALAGTGIGLALAPTAAAAIAAGIIGGAGLGGVIGGVLLASQDTRVQAAGKDLAATVLADLEQRAGQFVGPVLDGIGEVKVAWASLDDDLDRIFASSRFMEPLIAGGIAGGKRIVSGIADVVSRADPVMDQLGDTFARVGATIGTVFTQLSHDSDEGASALDDVTMALQNFITVSGDIIHAGAVFKGYTDQLDILIDKGRVWIEDNSALSKSLSDVGVSLDITADGFKKNSVEAEAYRRVQTGAGTAVDEARLKAYALADAQGLGADAARAAGNAAAAEAGAHKATADAMQIEKQKSEDLAAQQAQLKIFTDSLKAAQDGLQHSLDSLGGATSKQGMLSAALKTAMDNLYGAAIRNTDANEAYQASWDSLSASVHTNRRSLDVNTVAGRANRDALEGLLTSNGELYVANIAAGVSEDTARKKHDARTEAIRREAVKLGLNKAATQQLIDTYGKIPKAKTTDLLLKGVNAVAQALRDLYVFQRSLADGIPIASEIAKLKGEKGPAKKYGGYATGGQIGGWSPNSKADNIPALLTAKEWVHPVDAVNYYGPQVMSAIQKRQVPREVLTGFAGGTLGKLGDLPIFATGGQVAPIDTSRRWPFVTNAGRTHVMSKAQAAAKIPIGSGPGGAFVRAQDGKPYIWADAGPGGYDCSGIVSAVYNVLHGRNPYSHTFSTGSLPGRWFTKPGIGGPLTAAWSNPGEYPASSTTGHMMGMVNGLTFESSGSRGVHLGASTRRLTDFAHIAHYNRGGQVPFASYDSGGYLPPGVSLAHNGTGRPERVGGGDTYVLNFNISGPVASQRQLDDMVVGAVKRAQQSRRLL